ncbi:probable serine/threonine-protein kinase isoform X2 [Tanacetum coccineum]
MLAYFRSPIIHLLKSSPALSYFFICADNRYNNGALSHWSSNSINDDFNKLVTAGWPPWLASVVGEALNRWSLVEPIHLRKLARLEKVKHYMHQLISGLKHCHDHQVLIRVLEQIVVKRLKVYSNKDEMEFAVEVEILIRTYDRL